MFVCCNRNIALSTNISKIFIYLFVKSTNTKQEKTLNVVVIVEDIAIHNYVGKIDLFNCICGIEKEEI